MQLAPTPRHPKDFAASQGRNPVDDSNRCNLEDHGSRSHSPVPWIVVGEMP
jgi:hypothetical protein